MDLHIVPLYDKILVEKANRTCEVTTSSGIILPNDDKEQFIIVKVLAVGEGRLTPEGKVIAMKVKVDDTIYCTKYAGTVMDDTHIIIREQDVLAIIPICESSDSCTKRTLCGK